MKNVVICAPLEEELLENFERLKDMDYLRGANVHIVHCFEVQMYAYEFMAAYYPTDEQFKSIETSVKEILENFQKKISSAGDEKTQWSYHVLKSTDCKGQIVKYLEESGADLAIMATRGKHGIEGLFTSSFADYMIKHAPCDLTILRPAKN